MGVPCEAPADELLEKYEVAGCDVVCEHDRGRDPNVDYVPDSDDTTRRGGCPERCEPLAVRFETGYDALGARVKVWLREYTFRVLTPSGGTVEIDRRPRVGPHERLFAISNAGVDCEAGDRSGDGLGRLF